MERAKLFFPFFLFFVFFVGINILFLDNLRKIWNVGFPLILLVINLDLIILVVVFSIFFRKFIKTYLQAQRGNLRRRLSNFSFVYVPAHTFSKLGILNSSVAIHKDLCQLSAQGSGTENGGTFADG
jgi:hypothetical protein